MALGFHHGGFYKTTSFHHDGILGPYNLFIMTTSFHHDGSLEPYNLLNPSMMEA
jgi:hypothetical protein